MNTEKDITLVIADNHQALCEGLASLFKDCGIRVVDLAFNGEQLVEKVRQHRPDVALVDVLMPVMDGPTATKMIKQEFPQTKVIAFSAFDELGLIEEMNEAGAEGYAVKETRSEELFMAIKKVHGGEFYYCPSAARRLAKRKTEPVPEAIRFTRRELEVLKLICKGYSNKMVAAELGIKPRTVETFRSLLYHKTKCQNVVQLTLFAVRHGLV